MAIVEDASTPAAATTSNGTGAQSTAPFTPPNNSLVVVMYAFGWATSGATTATIASSPAATWTTPISQTGTTTVNGMSAVSYSYFATSPGALTVTCTPTNNSGGVLVSTKVLTGANSSQAGAATAGTTIGTTSVATTDFTTSITTTTAGSHVYGMVQDGNNWHTHTAANAATTNIFSDVDSAAQVTLTSIKATSDTSTPGATTLGTTSSTPGGQTFLAPGVGSIVLFEVLPAAAAIASPQLVQVNDQALVRASRW